MRVLSILGKLLISVGAGILLFVGWTLWGTGLYTNQQQNALEDQFNEIPVLRIPPAEDEPFEVPDSFRPGPGSPAFRLVIPKIDLRKVVVEGVGVEELHRGPGHYPECRPGFERPLCTDFEEVWPGENGRAVISGHRTTYGAPFWDLDKLERGDPIITETKWGEFTYRVTRTEIVAPDALGIVVPSDQPELVLTTCNPRFSAAQRLIVFAEMEEA